MKYIIPCQIIVAIFCLAIGILDIKAGHTLLGIWLFALAALNGVLAQNNINKNKKKEL